MRAETHVALHVNQGCINPGRLNCTEAPNICGSLVWNLLHVTFLAPKNLRWLLDFWKMCATLQYTNTIRKNDYLIANN